MADRFSGLIFKRYACCSASHFAADAALALKQEHAIDPASVVEATVTFARGGDAALTVRQPRTGLEGRFSVEYVVAAALQDGRLGLDLFADAPVRPELASLSARVERRIDPDAPPVSNDPATRFSTVRSAWPTAAPCRAGSTGRCRRTTSPPSSATPPAPARSATPCRKSSGPCAAGTTSPPCSPPSAPPDLETAPMFRSLAGTLLAAAALLAAPLAHADSTLDRVKDRGVLTAGIW